MKPLAENLNAIARDAARISGLAAGQVERVDRLVTDVASRLEHTATTVQDAILRPLREGAAIMAGVKSAIEVFRELTGRQGSTRTRSEDEDALFIGSGFARLTRLSIGGRNRRIPLAQLRSVPAVRGS